ncbi:MAG: RNA-guided endonuclease InsQ/TnpB family protein [Candidatus Hodarchaeales archaeon]
MVIQSYFFKTGNNNNLKSGLKHFLDLITRATDSLLTDLWTEAWVECLGTSRRKAYKVVDEKQVKLEIDGSTVYLPSRIRRGIAEQVGRVLRSQYERKCCFEDVHEVIEFTGLTGNLDNLVRQVARTLHVFHGKYYRWQLIRQTLRMMRKLHYRLGLDFRPMHYTMLVQPRFTNTTFPYGADDNQAIKFTVMRKKIKYRIKLPKVAVPRTTRDWKWHEETLVIPKKLREKLADVPTPEPKRPDLRLYKLQGGLEVPVLQFAWEFIDQELNVAYYNKKRVLAVDVGLVHLTTSVVGQAGSQVTPPLFYNGSRGLYIKIETIYKLIRKLQRKLANYPADWRGQTRRQVEVTRLHAKLTRCRKQHVYKVSKELLAQTYRFGCGTIALEDLRTYSPPKGKGTLSRRLNNWLRGILIEILTHKAKKVGIRVITVPAYWTSSYCPRCGKKGKKVATTRSKKAIKTGRFFWCPHCHFRGDRDYTGALNVYRVYLLPKKQRYRLATAKPVLYKKMALPSNRPAGIPVTSG